MAGGKSSIAIALMTETLSCAVRLAVQWLEQQQLVAVRCSGVELQEKIAQFVVSLERGDQLLVSLSLCAGTPSEVCSKGLAEEVASKVDTGKLKIIPEVVVAEEEVEVFQEVGIGEDADVPPVEATEEEDLSGKVAITEEVEVTEEEVEVSQEIGVSEEADASSVEATEEEDLSGKVAITEEVEATGEVEVSQEGEEQPDLQTSLSLSLEDEDPVDDSFSWHNSDIMPPLSDSALEAISSFEDASLSQTTSPRNTAQEAGMEHGGGSESAESIPELHCQGDLEVFPAQDDEKSAGQSSSELSPEQDNTQGFAQEDNPEECPEAFQDVSSEDLQQDGFSVPALPAARDVSRGDSSDDEDDNFDQFLADMREAVDLVSTCTKPVKAERLQDFIVPDDADLSVVELSSTSSTPVALHLPDSKQSRGREKGPGGCTELCPPQEVVNLLDSFPSPPSPSSPGLLLQTSPCLRDHEQYQFVQDSVKRLRKEQPSRRSSIHAYILSDDCGELLEEELESDGETEGVLVDEREMVVEAPDLTSTPLHQATLNTQNITPTADIPCHLQMCGKENVDACQTPAVELIMPRGLPKKDALARRLFHEFNSRVFGNQLPSDMAIVWNKRLVRTAGFCTYVRALSGRSASIDLSIKVCSEVERTRETLLHEMCHAAVWLVDGQREAHGPFWKAWVAKAERAYPGMHLNRCHNFDIEAKFLYKCTRCDYTIKRHSKSIDVNSTVCPCCKSPLALYNGDGTIYTPRKPNRFAAFVKENYASVKNAFPGTPHQEVMKILSANFSTPKNV